MYCRNCGKEIKDNTAFCPNCGASVSADSGTEKRKRSEKEPVIDTRTKKEKILSWELLALGFLSLLSGVNFWDYAMRACTGENGEVEQYFIVTLLASLILSIVFSIQYFHSKRKKTIGKNLKGSEWLVAVQFILLLISMSAFDFTSSRDMMIYANGYNISFIITHTIFLIILSALTMALAIPLVTKKPPTKIRKIIAAVIAVLLAIALCLITILPSMSRLNQPLYGNGLPKNRNINWGESYDSVKNKVDGAVDVSCGETKGNKNYYISEMRQDFWKTGVPAEIEYYFGEDTKVLEQVNICFKCADRDTFEKLEPNLLEKLEEQYGPSDSSASGADSISSYKGYGWHCNEIRLSMLMSPGQQTETACFGKTCNYYEIILIIHPQYR